MLARVVASNRHRDVALLLADALPGASPLPIRRDLPPVGADVFAIGAPLREELHGTVNRGVVSAYRDHDGLPFIQADIGIHAGNSGGPMLDANGNLVGLSVLGLRDQDGAISNLNLFIPIDSALAALNITVGP